MELRNRCTDTHLTPFEMACWTVRDCTLLVFRANRKQKRLNALFELEKESDRNQELRVAADRLEQQVAAWRKKAEDSGLLK